MQSNDTSRQLSQLDRELIERRIHFLADARARGDVAGMLKYAAPDIVFKVGGGLSYPFYKTCTGKDSCGYMAHAVNVAYENFGSTINSLLIDGDRVALQRTASIRNRGTGRSVSVEICNFLRFRDGLVVEFSEFPDTAAFAQLENPDL